MEKELSRTRCDDLGLDQLDDIDLLRMVRDGRADAYATIYDRYVYSARRLARHLGQREESDDVVSEAFAQVFDLLQRGKGPDRAFRAYLFTAIRHESGRRAKARQRVTPTDDDAQIDTAVPFGGGGLDAFETAAIRAAYESLPERWRTVLWHLDVEGRKPAELADVMGLKANSVSALVYRARSGLRDAYLQQHVNTDDDTAGRTCHSVRSMMAGVVRRSAPRRDQEKVHSHLAGCDACMAVYVDLEEVNHEVGLIAAPAALAAAAGSGAIVTVVAHGGAIVAQAVGAMKGLAAAVAAPVLAATVTGVAVLSVPSGHADQAPDATVVAAPHKQRTVQAPAVDDTPEPSAKAADDVAVEDDDAPAAAADARRGQPASAPDPSASTPSTPSSTPTTQPGATLPTVPPVDLGAVKVDESSGSFEVTAGPVKVSTAPVGDVLEKAAPETTKLVKGLLGVPAE